MSDLKKDIAINDLVASTLVPHTAFNIARAQVEQAFKYASGAAEPTCIALIGESRTGKSRVLEDVFNDHRKLRKPEGSKVPILHVYTPSKPSVKSLAGLLLKTIGDPHWDKDSENTKTARLMTLMAAAETKMMMIDEFQHFQDKGTAKIAHHVADWLKVLVDECSLSLVVAGIPTCREVINCNEQLAGRFNAPILMPRFNWGVEENREEFMAIMGAFHSSLSQHFELPELDTEEMSFRFWMATGGLIGYLTHLLRKAVRNAIDNNSRDIGMEQFAIARQQALWQANPDNLIINPFDRAFPQCNSAMINIGLQIGTQNNTAIKTRKRRGPSTSTETVSQIFSAT
jgi:hypothetical protein